MFELYSLVGVTLWRHISDPHYPKELILPYLLLDRSRYKRLTRDFFRYSTCLALSLRVGSLS